MHGPTIDHHFLTMVDARSHLLCGLHVSWSR